MTLWAGMQGGVVMSLGGEDSCAAALRLGLEFRLGLEPVLDIATVGFAVVFKEQMGAACDRFGGGDKVFLRWLCVTGGRVEMRGVCGAECHGMFNIQCRPQVDHGVYTPKGDQMIVTWTLFSMMPMEMA